MPSAYSVALLGRCPRPLCRHRWHVARRFRGAAPTGMRATSSGRVLPRLGPGSYGSRLPGIFLRKHQRPSAALRDQNFAWSAQSAWERCRAGHLLQFDGIRRFLYGLPFKLVWSVPFETIQIGAGQLVTGPAPPFLG